MKRRTFISSALGAALGGVAVHGAGRAFGQPAPVRIPVKAAKFEFTPSEITVKRGNPVTLVLTSVDFDHGFSCPDFKLRSDLIPGKEIELTFTPARVGRVLFTCDNFCGEGHDDMSGDHRHGDIEASGGGS